MAFLDWKKTGRFFPPIRILRLLPLHGYQNAFLELRSIGVDIQRLINLFSK
jgi:hypothetical protein